MDLATKIKLTFASEQWVMTEFALAWVFFDPITNKLIQVSKDLSRIDIISEPAQTLFMRDQRGRYQRCDGPPVRTDEMFRLFKNFISKPVAMTPC